MSSLDVDRLGSAQPAEIKIELEGIPPATLTPVDIVFLICRGHRVELVGRLIQGQDQHGRALAELLNDALLHVFVNGDWDNPYLLQESDYDIEAPKLWEASIGPVSVSMAEMARFLGNVRRHCPKIWAWINVKPFARRYVADEYRSATFERGYGEAQLYH